MLNYLILSLFSYLISGEKTLQCGDWNEYKDLKCLKVFNNTFVQSYSAAKNTCYQYEGSSLVSLHSQEEQEFLLNLIYTKHGIVNDVWIGADYRNETFHWSDNSTSNYTNWANGYPDNSGYECVSMGFTNHGNWVNEPCEKMNSVVCEKSQNWLFSYLQNTVMKLRDDNINLSKELYTTKSDLLSTKIELVGYKSELNHYKSELNHVLTNASTGCLLSEDWIKCDHFVDFRTNKRQVLAIPKLLAEKFIGWEIASNVCKKLGANLVSVESPEKQLFLENFVQSNTTGIWSSGYSSAVDKKWRWINGHEVNYSNWAPGQPDNGYPNEPCLELNWNGHYQWNDAPCTRNNLALCEFDL